MIYKSLKERIEEMQRKLDSNAMVLNSRDARIVELNEENRNLDRKLNELYDTFRIISNITKDGTIKALCETRKEDIKRFVYIKEEGEE